MAERSYISDPDLLQQLEAPAPTPAPTQAPERSYVSDPDLLRQLGEAGDTKAAIPEAPWGNELHAGASAALNTGTLNLYRNALAAGSYGLGKLGVSGFPDMPIEEHYQRWKAYDDEVAGQNPKSAIAGTIAGTAGAVMAAPAVLPEAGMAALYAGGAPAVARSAAIGAGLAGGATLADTHDPKKAAVGAALGAVAGPVADKVANAARPLFVSAEKLVPAEVTAAFGRVAPGSTDFARARVAQATGQAVGGMAGGAAGGLAGAGLGMMLPGEYAPYAAGSAFGLAGAEAGRRAVSQLQRDRAGLASDRLYYRKGNGGAALVGAALPQALYGLLGPGD